MNNHQDPRLLELLTLYVGKMTLGGCREFATLGSEQHKLLISIEGVEKLIHFEPVDNDSGLWKAYPLREWRESRERRARLEASCAADMEVYKAAQVNKDKEATVEKAAEARLEHAITRLRADHRELQKGLCESIIRDAANGKRDQLSQITREKYLPWLVETSVSG